MIERPPTQDKFLAIKSDGDQAVVWFELGYLKRGGWYSSCEYGCGGDDYFVDITHWMPLPRPPKEDVKVAKGKLDFPLSLNSTHFPEGLKKT